VAALEIGKKVACGLADIHRPLAEAHLDTGRLAEGGVYQNPTSRRLSGKK
jgi:hypothetical protein